MKIKKIRSLSMAVAVAFLALVAVPAPANAATVNQSIDCDALKDQRVYFYAPAGDTVTLNLTNCSGSADSEPWGEPIGSVTPSTGTLEMQAGQIKAIFDSAEVAWVTVFVGSVNAQHTPSGSLLLSKNITIPAVADELTTGVSSDPNDPEADHNLGGKVECGIETSETNLHIYTTLDIKISKAGTYTFRATGSDPVGRYQGGIFHPLQDSFLAVYKGFDPANPDEGVVGCNDDMNDVLGYDNDVFVEDLGNGLTMEGHQPYFVTTLQPGFYTLVLMTWDVLSAAEWSAGDTNGRTFTAGPASTAFEMWGPTGGLTEGAEPEEESPGLADTGATSTTLQYGLAGLLTVAGAVLLLRRAERRR